MPHLPPAPDALDLPLRWNNRFATLGDAFYAPLSPTPLPAPYWVGTSAAAARSAGWDEALLSDPEL